ncbi:MAG: SAM-dependent methyltransferase [Spirochaetaceae bacterium]
MIKNIESLYKAIKLGHSGNKLYAGRSLKLKQLQDYKKQMDSILKKITKKSTIHLVESCAGNCFVSFYLAWFYQDEFPGIIKFTCIEQNERLMSEAKETAMKLGLDNMSFITSDVNKVDFKNSVSVVFSLHACDMATDYTIALGIKTNARYILSVSCCQFTAQNRLKPKTLSSATRHSVYKEQLTAILADSLRTEFLIKYGFKTDIFAFTSVKNSGKNIMLRAMSTPLSEKKKQDSLVSYNLLKSYFKNIPVIESLLEQYEKTKYRAVS